MMNQIKINGIRLNKNYLQVTQEEFDRHYTSGMLLYQALQSKSINLVFMALNTLGDRSFISGAIASRHLKNVLNQDGNWACKRDICTLSIYPHHYRFRLLGGLLSLLGQQKISFWHMVSSKAMLTFVVDQQNCDAFIELLSSNFDLPKSHVPFEQEENDELTKFLKKKYPETRATYVEEKIKTYGITLETDLTLNAYRFSFDQLAGFGRELQSIDDSENSEDKFFHTCAHLISPENIRLFLLTGKSPGFTEGQTCPAELLSFHGPHFGDRHSIISRALNCLSKKSIPVLQAACTGSSIGIILAQGKGEAAKQALTDVFENP
ncbi:hypothetical protein [Desulfobacula phenolica]|nr:hypothetical protein [Desulfobacula phenolica]